MRRRSQPWSAAARQKIPTAAVSVARTMSESWPTINGAGAADGGRGWTEDRNVDIIVKYTSARREIVKKARPHAVDPNLELDASALDSMQKLNADLGYLKYT